MPSAPVNTPDRQSNPTSTSEAAGLLLTGAQRRAAAALAEVHNATVIEITALADVSKSSVAKTLTLLERAGAAIRTVREEDGVREADLWSPGPVLSALLFTADAGGSDSDSGDARDEEGTHAIAAPNRGPDEAAPERSVPLTNVGADTGTTSDAESQPEAAAGQPVGSAMVAETVVAGPSQPDGSAPDERARRLAPGELAAMVAAALEAHPDIEYTPTMLSHLLDDRSPGAIHNVLEKMVASGAVVRTRDKPKHYRHAAAELSKPA